MSGRRLIGLALVGAALVLMVPAAASANTIDSFTLSSSTAAPGDVVTATATWTATDDLNRDIFIQLPAALNAVWDSASSNPARACFVDSPPTDAACLWNTHVSGDTITLTALFTVPASATPGDYTLTASASPVDSNGPETAVLTVAAPPTTAPPTTASPTTTAAPTPGVDASTQPADVPTAVPAGQLPESGFPTATASALALLAIVTGLVLVRGSRRLNH